jgi:hypothetical protein
MPAMPGRHLHAVLPKLHFLLACWVETGSKSSGAKSCDSSSKSVKAERGSVFRLAFLASLQDALVWPVRVPGVPLGPPRRTASLYPRLISCIPLGWLSDAGWIVRGEPRLHPEGILGYWPTRAARSAAADGLALPPANVLPSLWDGSTASRRDARILAGGRGRVFCGRHPRKPSPKKLTRTPAGVRGKPRGVERAATGGQALAGPRPAFIGTH